MPSWQPASGCCCTPGVILTGLFVLPKPAPAEPVDIGALLALPVGVLLGPMKFDPRPPPVLVSPPPHPKEMTPKQRAIHPRLPRIRHPRSPGALYTLNAPAHAHFLHRHALIASDLP